MWNNESLVIYLSERSGVRDRDRNALQGINLEKADFRTEHQQEVDVYGIPVNCKGNIVVVCCLKIRVRPLLAYVCFK